MQVGEQHLAWPHPVVLDRDWLLDLQDKLCLLPHLVGARGDFGPGCCEFVIGD
jgi:hypothetical protein